MNNLVKSAWSQDMNSEDMLDVLRQRVDQVAAENAQHREANRANAETEAAQSMRNAANIKLARFGVNLDNISDRILGQFAIQIRSLIVGQLYGPAEADLARNLIAAQEIAERHQKAQEQKQYTVLATRRTDSLGALNVIWDGKRPALQHVRVLEYRGVAQRTMSGFVDDRDAVNTLGNPINANDLLGSEVRPETALPDILESLAEIKAAANAPNLDDYVLVIIGDDKLKNIDTCVACPLLDIPRLTTRELPASFPRRESQRAHFVTMTIPSARVASALANQINDSKRLPHGMRTTTVVSKLIGEL